MLSATRTEEPSPRPVLPDSGVEGEEAAASSPLPLPSEAAAAAASASGGAVGAEGAAGARSVVVSTSRPVGEAIDTHMDSERALSSSRLSRFARLLSAPVVDLGALRSLAWSGVPHRHRAIVWQQLLGYCPLNSMLIASTLERKRSEYQACVRQHFRSSARAGSSVGRTEPEQQLLRQVLVDVPRTLPSVPVIHADFVQRSLERVLYVWAVRHPASGYVQGINDIATPFYVVFLARHASALSKDLSGVDKADLQAVEADVYWCLTRLLDGIQDHYTPSQPGIQRMVHRLRELLLRIDGDVVRHIESEGLEMFQVAFRWMNCLLLRELPMPLVLRLWDTYFAEGGGEGGAGVGAAGFETFHSYVCAALVAKFSRAIRDRRGEHLIQFLQDLPTKDWKTHDLEEVLSQAYILKSSFERASAHLARP